METQSIGNAIGVPTPDENNPGNNSQQNLFAFLFGNSDNSQNGHDTSGHCQKMIHVPAHSREGKPVNAYERICGRDHDEKEAQQKNQAEKNENNVKLTTEQLAKKAFEFMQSHEGGILYPYFDSKGNLTVGYGTRIYNQAQYAAMDWKINNISLTKTQKEVNYEKAMAFKSEYGHNRTAKSQEKMQLLGKISKSDARFMAEQHIQKEFIPTIRNDLAKKKH